MTPTDIKNIDLSKHTVLAVDDIPMNLLLISKILSRLNITINTASNGREALDFISKNKPSLVLLDLMMPGLDGMETFREMKKQFPDKPIDAIDMRSYGLMDGKAAIALAEKLMGE